MIVLTVIYARTYLLWKLKLIPHWVKLSQRKEAPQKLIILNNRKDALVCDINQAENEITRAKHQQKADINRINREYDNAKEKATEHAVAGLAVMDALDDTFGDMIDMRDWENIDILIYALETRRAENMKEALQVVDGERRTERIVEAVNTAGQEICKSINTGLRRLQGEMTRCFGVLGELVVLQGDRIAGHMQNLSDGIATSNNYIAQLTSQQSMTNALMAKANENSAAIVAEVNRLRVGTEYAQARYMYDAN